MPDLVAGAPPVPLPVPSRPPRSVGDAADRILARPEFEPEPQPLLERAQDWVSARLGDIAGTLFGSGPGRAVGWFVVLAVGGLAVYALVRSLRPRLPRPAARAATVGTEARRRRSPQEWWDEADRLEQAGEHRGALRAVYQAVLGELTERGLAQDLAGRTSGEHRREVAARAPALAPALGRLTDAFERTWYGGAPAGAGETAAARAAAREVAGAQR